MDTLRDAAACYDTSDLARLRTAAEDLKGFAEVAAPTYRERVRWIKVLELIRVRVEAAIDRKS